MGSIFSFSFGNRDNDCKYPKREPREVNCFYTSLTPQKVVFSSPKDIVKNNVPKTKLVLPPPPPPPVAPT